MNTDHRYMFNCIAKSEVAYALQVVQKKLASICW